MNFPNQTKALIVTLICLLSAVNTRADAVPGGIYAWPLPAGATDVRFNNKPVLTTQGHALVGIPISAKPGDAKLTYRQNGQTKSHTYAVSPKTYTEQHITIENQDMVTPPQATLDRISTEAQQQRALYNSFSDGTAPAQFILPVEGPVSSLFGHRRFFNGQPRSPHSGLDIAAPAGTPIIATAAGRVVLAAELYFNGNTVFLDHGQGLITMYCHMQDISVSVDDTVNQGQEIGLVGATGRVTGPHLHWSVSLNGNRVDPTSFMDTLAALNEPVDRP